MLVALAPARAKAAAAPGQTGAQLLQAQLPNGTNVTQADCEQLTRAVSLATRAHRPEVKAILTAALSRNVQRDPSRAESKLSCACVTHLLRAAIGAAPEKASVLLELASSLYPNCADSLEAAVQSMDDKNVVDDKNGPARGRSATDGAHTADDAPMAVDADGTRPDTNAPNTFDPALETAGFGVGFGPGFPGSPGFTGSSPSGAIALPPETNPVTSVQNG